jgi:hypothetical protein
VSNSATPKLRALIEACGIVKKSCVPVLVCQAAVLGLASGGESLLTESSSLICAATSEISKRILSWFRSEHKRGSSLSSISCFNRSSRSLLLSTKDRTYRRVRLRTAHQCRTQSWIVPPRWGFPQFQLLPLGLKRFANEGKAQGTMPFAE